MHFESKLYGHEIISLDVNDHKIAQLDVNVKTRWTYITLVYTLVTCIFADFALLKVFFFEVNQRLKVIGYENKAFAHKP